MSIYKPSIPNLQCPGDVDKSHTDLQDLHIEWNPDLVNSDPKRVAQVINNNPHVLINNVVQLDTFEHIDYEVVCKTLDKALTQHKSPYMFGIAAAITRIGWYLKHEEESNKYPTLSEFVATDLPDYFLIVDGQPFLNLKQ